MNRSLILIMLSGVLLWGCHSTGEGAYVGGQFGYVIGSAIGGITGGGRGHDLGALIGTVSGVATGAAIGAAAESAREGKVSERIGRSRDADYGSRERSRHDDDRIVRQGRADDRVDLGLTSPGEPPLEIRHAGVHESDHDGMLTRGEECKVRFEIYNNSDSPVYDVRPIVEDVTGNKHVVISPNLLIESIGPRQGIRYTATIMADKRLKDGEIKVMVGVSHQLQEVRSQTRYFTVPTAKGAK